ncbi:hypothetical protein [Oceaniglobus indicus]|uniref:hypothetical protein n=1 Tax=Oceaniglobus indicus TaxID=2047749 RepID=UPI000C1A5DFE|nr:hypothetical protein [Oceaniglobus indicus]
MTRSLLLLAACLCASVTTANADTPRDRTVAAIEAAGCVVDGTNVNDVLDGLALSDDEFRVIGEGLVAEGLADVSQMGVFRLTTPGCTATAQTPKERTITAIEAAGCTVDRSNINEIRDGLALSDDDFRVIGEELMAEGLASVSEAGAFMLNTPNCN